MIENVLPNTNVPLIITNNDDFVESFNKTNTNHSVRLENYLLKS